MFPNGWVWYFTDIKLLLCFIPVVFDWCHFKTNVRRMPFCINRVEVNLIFHGIIEWNPRNLMYSFVREEGPVDDKVMIPTKTWSFDRSIEAPCGLKAAVVTAIHGLDSGISNIAPVHTTLYPCKTVVKLVLLPAFGEHNMLLR